MKRKLVSLIILSFILLNVQAQYANRDYVLGVTSSFIDFNAFNDQGWFKVRNWNNDIGPTRIHLTKSLGSAFNVSAQVSFAEIRKSVTPIKFNSFTDFGLDAHYKLANGYILEENHWFDPYVAAGAGLMRLNKQSFLMADVAVGSNLWLSDRFGLNLQTGVNLPFGFDSYQKHSFGIVVNLGNISDRDGDGVPDKLDKCPDDPGVASNHGCPEIKVADQILIDGIAKNIFFQSDSDVLMSESMNDLDLLADILKRNPDVKLLVEGHTDLTGSSEHNFDLSKRRAASVVKYLVDKGISADRLSSQGYGSTMPIATNATPEGRALNRRVELKVQ